MKRRWFLAALLAAAIAAPADARMHAPYRGHRIVPANVAPLDGFTSPSGAYSFRKLRTAYAGPAVKLQRVDTTTQDIGFVGSDFDTAAAAAFCTTACTVATWYDQSGLSRDLVQATAANQPAYIANCIGSLPCVRQAGSATIGLATAAAVTPGAAVSMSAVARRASGTLQCIFLKENGGSGNRLVGVSGVAAQWGLQAGASNIVAAAAEGVFHAANGVMNGTAASVINVDGVETTGTLTPVATAVAAGMFAVGTGTCEVQEAMWWDPYQLTPAERAALIQNQRNYWMPAPLDSFTTPSGAYSFRKLRSAYAGPAVRIRRASDNAETDINFLGCTGFTGCPWDSAAAAAHCAATSCFIVTRYDQSGAARHQGPQVTAANQPALVFNCIGTLPCMEVTLTNHVLQSAAITPATGNASLSAVANRITSATGACIMIALNGNTGTRIQTSTASATNWHMVAAGGNVNGLGAAANAWHAAQGVVNGAGSALMIDGVDNPGSTTGSVTAGAIETRGLTGLTCRYAEAIVWDNYALTLAERTFLDTNQRGFWQ